MRSSLRVAPCLAVAVLWLAGAGLRARASATIDVPCVGDCSGDGRVTVDEVVLGVNIALDRSDISACRAMDNCGDDRVEVNELVQAVNALLRGCATPTFPPPPPSPTATDTPSPTVTDTPSPTVQVETRTPTASPTATGTLSLLAQLKQGGFVIHWRHSAADVCADCVAAGMAVNPVIADWWKSCTSAPCATEVGQCTSGAFATARQLNDTGRMEAATIGEFFTEEDIPIGRVVSSEFCRNVETAQIMALGPAIEQRADITFFVYDDANRCASSMALIAQVPAAGTNTAIIGHAGFTGGCPVLGELAWSEAAIFKPDGEGGSTLIDRLLWYEWPTLR